MLAGQILGLWVSTACSTPVDVPGTPGGEISWEPLEEVSDAVGLQADALPRRSYGPAWIDLDGDEHSDLMFYNHSSISVYRNSGSEFVNLGQPADGPAGSYPQAGDQHGGACGDFDNDGDADLYVTRGAMLGKTLGTKWDELYVNDGAGVFTHSSARFNMYGRARMAQWGDFDRDGWLDLLVGNFRTPSVLYRNTGNGFVDVSETTVIDDPLRGQVMAWVDLDVDGFLDIASLLDPERGQLGDGPLRLYKNEGAVRFVEITEEWLVQPVEGHCMAWGDYDNDGDQDVFVGGDGGGAWFENTTASLRLDSEVKFSPAEGRGCAQGDMDNDGDLDLLASTTEGLIVFQNRAGEWISDPVFSATWTAGPGYQGDVAVGDYNNDGKLDIAADAGRHRLFENKNSTANWLCLRLRGNTSNRQGFGTHVKVDAGESVSHRWYSGASGSWQAAGCAPLHVGVGWAREIIISLVWPSGIEQTVEVSDVNRCVEIVEPG